jgi:hypothetical protein
MLSAFNGTGRNVKVSRKVSVAIPASVVSDTPHLREKTAKIGLIGRAVAIFRIHEIIVYQDMPKANQTSDTELIATLLSYMETPQYLRKRLFKIKPELQFAGILPPLRTAHHPLNRQSKNLKLGEYREGVTVSQTKVGVLVDVGVEQPALVLNKQLSMNKRVTVRITGIDKQIQAEIADREEIQDYWGYIVDAERQTLGKLLRSRKYDLIIGTSKYGVSFGDMAEKIREKWKAASTVLVAFGSPTQGLHEIIKREGLNLDEIMDYVVNLIPAQGTETVRTEEALIASLAILNSLTA